MSLVSYVDKSPAGYRMNSPLLFQLLQSLAEEGYYQFLDITPATPGLLDYFSQYHCKLYLPGCINELWRMTAEELDTPHKLNRALVGSLGLYRNNKAKLDVILLWDLPNYLDKQILSGLIEYLLPHTANTVYLHCYIYTRQEMPASPGRYQFTPENKMWVEHPSEQMIACPAYYQEVLHKLLHPFVVHRSILLSNGLQEYILKIKSTSS